MYDLPIYAFLANSLVFLAVVACYLFIGTLFITFCTCTTESADVDTKGTFILLIICWPIIFLFFITELFFSPFYLLFKYLTRK